MKNGLGAPQGVLLIGGTSDIGTAALRCLVGPGVARVATLSRDSESARAGLADLAARRPETDWLHESADLSDVGGTMAALERVIAEMREIDVVIVAAAELTRDQIDPPSSADVDRVVSVNMASPIAMMDRLARLMAEQGGGSILLLSTVAMERVRPANALYGASKAGVDAYAQALDHAMAGSGVRVLVVRPGFVASKMTAGMPSAPLATTPDKVAQTMVKALRRGRRVSWSPGLLRVIFAIFRHLPTPIWRRLPL